MRARIVALRAIWSACAIAGCGGGPTPAASGAQKPAAVQSPPITNASEAPVSPHDERAAQDAALEFQSVLGASKPEIARCYEAAAAKDAMLRVPRPSVEIAAEFDIEGRLARLQLDPPISDDFLRCVKAIMAEWKLAVPRDKSFATSFKATVALSR